MKSDERGGETQCGGVLSGENQYIQGLNGNISFLAVCLFIQCISDLPHVESHMRMLTKYGFPNSFPEHLTLLRMEWAWEPLF
jgi:hypothetical protein